MAFPIESKLPNGVHVFTCRITASEYKTGAIFRGRLLNLLLAASPVRAGRQHRLLAEAWSKATEGNLLDESQDAPPLAEEP